MPLPFNGNAPNGMMSGNSGNSGNSNRGNGINGNGINGNGINGNGINGSGSGFASGDPLPVANQGGLIIERWLCAPADSNGIPRRYLPGSCRN